MKQASISICNQKGGIGKSTFTMLLASHLHYTLGYDVLVVDCDYPQWSVQAQRERELSLIEHDDYHKLLLVRQFKATGRKLWPVLKCMPPEAPEEVERLLQSGYHPRIILYDLPGTVNAEGVIRLLASLDAVFVPMKADKVVMESTLSFARSLTTNLAQDPTLTLQSVYLFWTMIDRRERTPLYDRYEAVIRKLGLSLMTTHIPYRSKFNKELLADNTGVGRSTLLAPARTFACEAQLEILAGQLPITTKVTRVIPEQIPSGTATDAIPAEPPSVPEIDTEKIPDETPSVSAAQEPRRRRTPPLSDYERMFLTPVEYGIRATLYVNASTKRKILEILKRIGGERLSATSYVDNILQHHIETFRDDINRLDRKRNFEKLV